MLTKRNVIIEGTIYTGPIFITPNKDLLCEKVKQLVLGPKLDWSFVIYERPILGDEPKPHMKINKIADSTQITHFLLDFHTVHWEGQPSWFPFGFSVDFH